MRCGKVQTIPTTMVTGYWDPDSTSEIPDVLLVPMSDGTVVQYYPQIEQPAFKESLEIIRGMKDQIVGYERK